jgi:DMSO/TMAO reductase YedYZ heme-binding membrane subunit
VTILATVETLDGLIRGTILVGSIVGVVRALHLLILVELLALLERWTLLKLSTVPLVRWPLVLLLVSLLVIIARTGATTRDLLLTRPLLGFNSLALTVSHNGAVHQALEIRIGIGHQLYTEIIIKTSQEAALFISIISNIFRCIT